MNKRVLLPLSFILMLAGCGGSSSDQASPSGSAASQAGAEPLSMPDLVDRLARYGVEFDWMEKSQLTPEQVKNLGTNPVNHSSVWLKKDKEKTAVTLIEFKNAAEAQNVKNVNGLALHNWYFAGDFNQYWVDAIKYAVE